MINDNWMAVFLEVLAMKCFYKVYSEIGNREHNEDAYLTLKTEQGYLFVVADGLGGHGNGEIAAKLVVDVIKELFLSDCSFDIRSAVNEINLRILCEQERMKNDMKSTIAIVWIKKEVTEIAHVGDSRIYMFCNNKIVYQSKDHSLAQLAVDMGKISTESIRLYEKRNTLFSSLGVNEDVQLSIHTVSNISYDRILLCSDGFWEYVLEKEMRMRKAKKDICERWLSKMVRFMRKRIPLGDDNATAIVVQQGGE